MATKDRRKLQHIHSSIADKQPTPQSLEVGEIAVNNSANKEFLSLKNSNDKVVRFSSDSTIIDWIENKEVIPYKGYVRGETGPSATSGDSPSADAYGSYGITNNDLLNNKSNIIVKINQVAAKNTVKYNKINAAKDRYNKDINPSENTPTGKTDGAGFFIDMSRYAMQGANPTFSGITNTCYTNLNGTTKIKGVNGACGSLLDITVNSAKTDIETANTEITSATTVIGTNSTTISGNTTLNVSGTTTETKKNIVTENNLSAKTENTTGVLTENNSSNHIVNTTGTTTIKSTGSTNIETNGDNNKVTIQASGNGGDVEVFAKDTLCESGVTAAFNGTTKTNIGLNCNDATSATTTNIYGTTINHRANSADTRVTSAYTSATTATTVIGTANTSATTATLSGNTLDITEATRLSAKTPSTYVSGTSLSVVETNTDIESCGRISGKTNEFTIQECATGSGKTVINQTDIKASGKTLSFDETTSISAKTPTTTLSGTGLTITETTSTINSTNTNLTGTNLTISESNTSISSCTKLDIVSDDLNFGSCTTAGTIDFNFCNGFGVNSNNIKLHQCASAGTISISAQTQNINGGNLTVNESGNTAINTTGTTNIKSTGNTNVETNGANNKVTIQASGTGGDVEVFAKDTLCASGGTTAAFVGAATTNIGSNCSDGGNTASLNVRGVATNISAGTITETVTGATNETHTGAVTINNGSTKVETTTGAVTENNGAGYTVNTTGDTCLQSTADVNVGGAANTNIGTNCDDSIKANYVNIKAKSGITETANTVTISGTTSANISGATVNVSGGTINETSSGNTCITAGSDLNIGGDANTNIGYNCAGTGIANNTNIYASGTTTINSPTTTITGNTNISGNTVIGGNTNISGDTHIKGTLYAESGLSKTLSWTYGDVKSAASGSTNFKDNKSFAIPKCVNDLNRHLIKFQSGSTTAFTSQEYDPGKDCANSAETINIPTKITHLINDFEDLTIQYGTNVANRTSSTTYDGSSAKTVDVPTSLSGLTNGVVVDTNTASTTSGCISFTKPLCVTGTITASGAIYSSDRNLKENIMNVSREEINKASNVLAKSFNFKSDESKSKVYGVIAQEVQEAGLDELVHTDDNGNLGVDYTSLLLLKIAYLEDLCGQMYGRIIKLEDKLKKE